MDRRKIDLPIPAAPGFRPVPFTGVIYVMSEAARLGYAYGHPDWCNLGQGMPETGALPGAPPRICDVDITPADQEYAPVAGVPELRAAVAELYNDLYRRDKESKYTADNVCICGGGRLSLTRTVAALGEINLGTLRYFETKINDDVYPLMKQKSTVQKNSRKSEMKQK